MLYSENTTNIPKIIAWLSAALSRATTQLQEPYIDIVKIRNPCYIDPFSLSPENYAFSLPDGYIIPTFPGTAEYETSIERNAMATEAVTNLTYQLATLTYKSHQSDDDFQAMMLIFFQQLYTWNTDLIWVDKVHPQDIVGNILFNGTTPTYANRLPLVGYLSPDNFLQNTDNYDITVWSGQLTNYETANQNSFYWGTLNPTFFYPGFGYQWAYEDQLLSWDSLSMALDLTFKSFLLSKVGTNVADFLSQNWEARVKILCSNAVYFNAYFSYIIRYLKT